MKNNTFVANLMANDYLGNRCVTANKLWFVIIAENEASVSEADAWADLTQVGTQVLSKTSCTCANRQIDCGALTFSAVGGGQPRAVAVLTDTTGGTPRILAVQDVNGGAIFDMDTLGAMAIDSLILKFGWNGET